jgi:hypothetical protein
VSSRTSWVYPGEGTSLRWLCAIVGLPIPALDEEKLDAPTSLKLHEDGILSPRDVERVQAVIARVIKYGSDRG